jgi:citrate synthase
MLLKDKIGQQLPEWRERVRTLIKEKGDVKVGEVTISQVYGGMRDVKSLVTDISYVDPKGAEMPYVGGLYYLFMVGSIPTFEQALEVEAEWKKRGKVPQYVFDTIRALPSDAHPMTLFTLAVLTLQSESLFSKQYHEGLKKDSYWEPMLEDSMNLIAKLPEIAAFIYNLKYKNGEYIPPDPNLDWA